MKPITTSSYTFSDLIEGGYLYVDKTFEILSLISESKGQYFLSRPRRFGKSLLISTLECIFRGRRELFKGLSIDASDYTWKTYPVIRLDMGSAQADSPELLTFRLISILKSIARHYEISLDDLPAIAAAPDYFLLLIERLANQSPEGKVVVLIDEYDKPLLNHIGNPEAILYRNILKNFYSVVKTTEGLQRFAFITGVSKFSKVSIFSDLNNLTDLTLDTRAATLLGYTEAELIRYYSDRLPALAAAIHKTEEETLVRLKTWYDGFRFSSKEISVYNPVSIGKCFSTLEFKNYWFETSTPTFLLDLLKKEPLELNQLTASEESFSVYEVEKPSVLPLLVQTGYLTIKDSFERGVLRRYRLGYPNLEIKNAFNLWLLSAFTNTENGKQENTLDQLVDALEAGNIKNIFSILPIFFARIPNTIIIQTEKYYQTILFTIFELVGAMISVETSTNIGRIDATIETDRYVYLFEFKLHDTAESAMAQIHERKYYERYLASGKTIQLIAVAFDMASRNIGSYLIETLSGGAS